MANLLNAVLQTSSNKSLSPDALPIDAKSKDLGELFQNSLKTAEIDTGSEELNAEMALAMGLSQSNQVPAVTKELTKGVVDADANSIAGGVSAKLSKQLPIAEMALTEEKIDLKQVLPNQVKTKEQPGLKTEQSELIQKQSLIEMKQGDQLQTQPLNTASILASMDFQINDDSEISGGASLMDLSAANFDDVSSVEVKKEQPKPVSSKFSTNDFLNLREISQKNAKPALTGIADSKSAIEQAKVIPLQASTLAVGTKPAQKKSDSKQDLEGGISSLVNANQPTKSDQLFLGKTVEATVNQSVSGQKPVISSESMNQIASQVNLLGQARQDGEIKIKLRPDHLGELQMSVRTNGQNDSVQIKAESEEAKKIIEDSLSSLREHLSSHQLSLANVDVVTQPSTPSGLDQGQMQFDGNNHSGQFANEDGRNQSGDEYRQSGRDFAAEGSSFVKPQSAFRNPVKNSDSSRLDMIA